MQRFSEVTAGHPLTGITQGCTVSFIAFALLFSAQMHNGKAETTESGLTTFQ